jgi:hypothetical protein
VQSKIVVHFTDGKISKGFATDFDKDAEKFHLKDKDTNAPQEVEISRLKAIFFVKDFDGNPDYQERHDFERTGLGKKIRVRFKDGEMIVGYTTGYSPDRPRFFLFPADPHSNNERIFVITAATTEVEFL